MNWADILILTMVGLSTAISLYRGFVREALSLSVWFAAFWVAFSFSEASGELLKPYVVNDVTRIILSFIGISLSVLIVGGILNNAVGKLIKKAHFSVTDRLLGLIFGFVRGGAVAVSFVLIAGLTSIPEKGWWQEAQTLRMLENVAVYFLEFAPSELARYFSY